MNDYAKVFWTYFIIGFAGLFVFAFAYDAYRINDCMKNQHQFNYCMRQVK